MYTVTVPTYEELQVMFAFESDEDRIILDGKIAWEYHTDEMRVPANRILEFSEIHSDDTMYDEHYDIYIHKSFYDYLKALEPQTFGTIKTILKRRPHATD